jgi:hypothetical protein
MDWVKFFEWITLAVALGGIVWRLAWLVRTRPGDHPSEAKDSGPDGSRRASWSHIRYMLVPMAGAASLLSGLNRWAGLSVVLAFLALAFASDYIGRARRARVAKS